MPERAATGAYTSSSGCWMRCADWKHPARLRRTGGEVLRQHSHEPARWAPTFNITPTRTHTPRSFPFSTRTLTHAHTPTWLMARPSLAAISLMRLEICSTVGLRNSSSRQWLRRLLSFWLYLSLQMQMMGILLRLMVSIRSWTPPRSPPALARVCVEGWGKRGSHGHQHYPAAPKPRRARAEPTAPPKPYGTQHPTHPTITTHHPVSFGNRTTTHPTCRPPRP